MASDQPGPSYGHSILIVGAGVFGLSTTLSLLRRTSQSPSNAINSTTSPLKSLPKPQIIVLDASHILPNPSGSSVDSSRIIRPDYPRLPYCRLATEAQVLWRDQSDDGWGGQGRYTESGLVSTADREDDDDTDVEGIRGRQCVKKALNNVRTLVANGMIGADDLIELDASEDITRVTGHTNGKALGRTGYLNRSSGWADAEASVKYALETIRKEDTEGRVQIMNGKRVRSLIFSNDFDGKLAERRCTGVELKNGKQLYASLVVLATGAWTPSIIDLEGRAVATGQILAYLELTPQEQRRLEDKPVFLNWSRGMFIIPPRNQELKIARHAFGYRNPKLMSRPGLPSDRSLGEEEKVEISTPEAGHPVPPEGQKACRDMLQDLFADSDLAARPFSRTRICWYCDTYEPISHPHLHLDPDPLHKPPLSLSLKPVLHPS